MCVQMTVLLPSAPLPAISSVVRTPAVRGIRPLMAVRASRACRVARRGGPVAAAVLLLLRGRRLSGRSMASDPLEAKHGRSTTTTTTAVRILGDRTTRTYACSGVRPTRRRVRSAR